MIRHKNQVLDEWCARGAGTQPRSNAPVAPTRSTETGDGYVEAGATLITLSFDGKDLWDLAPLNDWLSWRDQRNRQR